MKKLVALLALLALVAAPMFAADAETSISASFSGDASVTIGYDLDGGDFGFDNSVSASADLVIIAEQSATSTGDGVYGEIKVTIGELKNGAAPSASVNYAKIVFAPEFNIEFVDTTFGASKASLGEGQVPGLKLTTAAADAVTNSNANQDKGIKLNVALPDVLDFYVSVDSVKGYNDSLYGATAADENDADNGGFRIATGFGLTAVEGLTLGVAFDTSTATEESFLGAEAGYKLALGDSALTIQAAIDLGLNDPSVYLLGAGLGFDLDGTTNTYSFNGTDAEIKSGVGVGIALDQDSDIDLQAAVSTGALLPINVAAIVELADLGDEASTLGLGVGVSGSFDPVTLTATFWTVGESVEQGLTFKADLALIDNTTFTLGYTNENLEADNSGYIYFTTKVSL